MSFKYLGYDIQAMLSFIGQFSDKLTLKYNGKEWVLNIFDSRLGDKELKHPAITRCVVEAFKPYKAMSDECREKFKTMFDEIKVIK